MTKEVKQGGEGEKVFQPTRLRPRGVNDLDRPVAPIR